MKRRAACALALAAPGWPWLRPARAQEAGSWDFEDDVIVVGGGAAGLSAAVAARSRGLGVTILEKMPAAGGDTLRSGGFFNAVGPQAPGRPDSAERFRDEILASGEGLNDPAVVDAYARGCSESLAWLEGLGMRFEPEAYAIYGGGFARARRPVSGEGGAYVGALLEAALKAGARILTQTPAASLAMQDGRCAGVVAQRGGQAFACRARKGVVLASGGFGSNAAMVRRHFAGYDASIAADSHPGATGEMIEAAAAAGAALVNLGEMEFVPGSSPGIPYPIRLDYNPGSFVFVNASGRRFVDERGTRREIAAAFFAAGAGRCYAVADSRALALIAPLRRKNLYRGLYIDQAWRG
ncbi:MAG: FAD-dependent oxidoreductase, partial [Duodenibacillus sp.]|nr:FAD-dependent oxidoreductase [Duodenibacillus sp.]